MSAARQTPSDNTVDTQLDASKAALSSLEVDMGRMRSTLEELFRVEVQETALYVRETQLEMQAIRDVVQLDMEQVKRSTASAIESALEAGAVARREFERLQSETQAKTAALRDELRQRTEAHRDALQQ
ncbi:hypothetical protein PINS_up004175 [Pythium insidiosum]|nr:hypothetical protein PINS_up004175 [Pythium insidiosum]